MPKLVATLSLRYALEHKLVTILQAFGSASESARQLGCSQRHLYAWRVGESWPTFRYVDKIQEIYLMAVELLNNPELLKKQRKAKSKLHGIASKLHLSEDTVRLLQKEGLY